MNFKKIMVALAAAGDEESVIQQAVHISKKYRAKLIAIHVNPPRAGEMSMKMDRIGPKVEKKDILDEFKQSGFAREAKKLEISIVTGESIPKTITEHTSEVDLLILGHRKMSTFKANFLDSIDEGIVNYADCPVLVVPKEEKI